MASVRRDSGPLGARQQLVQRDGDQIGDLGDAVDHVLFGRVGGVRGLVAQNSLPPIRNLAVDADQHHLAVFIREAQGQDLGHEGADLARREVDDGGDLAADQLLAACSAR
jgi:hypothetical protein